MAVCIREFRIAKDHASAIRLWETAGNGVHVGPSDTAAEIEKKLQRDPDLFLVAEAEGRLVGTVIGGFDGRRGFIYHLAVLPEYRQRGVGGQLMDEVETRLRAKGCIRCYLLVMTDNRDALNYYEKRGWQLMNDLPLAKDLL
ncbi:MAG TPA: GNAT family N-acetyltransferase [Anaerolineales bacterium]|nr:GNAT family N-acetyltransferase [Anaerolineales bacterium]